MSTSKNEDTNKSTTTESDNRPAKSPSPSRIPEEHAAAIKDCEEFVDQYKKGSKSKAATYSQIERRIIEAVGDDTAAAEAAFESYIQTIENLDTEIERASRREKGVGEKRRADTPESIELGEGFEGEERFKKPKVDEADFPWSTGGRFIRPISENLSKSLQLLESFSVDPKRTKRSLVNSPNCPEFPDSEWKNVILGRAVNLDNVLSGQFSTSNNDVRTETVGDLEISYGTVEPTKTVTNGGEWTITWNRTIRATAYAFPNRFDELANYGEYVTSLFAATNPMFYSRVIAFDKAVRRRVGSVRDLELSEHDRFADLKIAHLDSIGVSIQSGSSRNDGNRSRGQRRRSTKKQEPCNKWNEDRCADTQDDCRRQHVCNRCGKPGHKGKDCKQQPK
jgi:hypothetical protein